jgi:RNA polymerase sigma-70 factor (ECF subfamily)
MDPGHFHLRMMESMRSPTDRRIEAEERFEQFVRQHATPLLAYCLRRTSSADAHEAAAEVFATAWRKYQDVPEGDAGLYWLFGVARRVLSNQRRGRRRWQGLLRRIESDIGQNLPSPEASAVASEQSREVRTALNHLRSMDREILTLVVWDEVPRSEVARMLGISPDAIHKRYQRALRRLEDQLNSRESGSGVAKTAVDEGGSA